MSLAIVGSARAAQSVTLAWSPSPDSKATGYNIYYGSACAQYTNHVWVSGVATTSTTISNLLDGVTYYFAATAYGSAGEESPFSNEVNYQSAPIVTSPVAPAITWSLPAAISYGTALTSAQLNATASVPGSFTYNPALNRFLSAGNGQTLTAVFNPTDTTKYTPVTTTVLLNVSKVPLTITANSSAKIYGAANPTLSATYSGFVNGDTAASLATPVSLTTPGTAASSVGTYAITASGATSPNYTIVFVNGSLNVTPAALTIAADTKAKVFGTANPTLTATYSGFVNGDTAARLITPVSLGTTATAASSIGAYAITASGAASPNYAIAFVNGTLNVTSTILTITANSSAKIYGAANPTLSATYSGFVNGDTAASLATPVSLGTTATAASSVGTYAISASGATSPNYTIVFVNGSLSVTPAALTIAADTKAKVFGTANPTLTATYSGFVNGDTAARLATPVSLGTTATAASSVGTYAITASGATSPNYAIVFVNGTLNVTSTILTITANSSSKTFGSANPTLTATYSGFVNGDTAASLATPVSLTTPATAASSVGTYAITASGATSPNYTIVFVNGSLNVTPAALTIAADTKAKVFGTANPTLTATYSGFVNGDTAARLATPVSLGTTATAASSVGTYAITASGATSPNYMIVFVNGSLSVTSTILTITANSSTKIYGAANPTLSATYSGFVNGDTAASLATPVSLGTTATAASSVGTYAISASGATSPNYAIVFVNGSLNVTPATLKITANSQSRLAGTANPVLTASYAGFVNGDTAASLTTPVLLATSATTSSPVGTYAITAGGAQDADYTINHVSGTLTVTAPAAASLVSLALTPSTGSVMMGQTAQFKATGNYSDGSMTDLSAAVSWTSSASGIASVSANGLATGLTAGTASIAAYVSGFSASAALTVKSNTPSGPVTLVSTRAMTIPSIGLASPYFTTINASGLPGVVSKVSVTLNNVTHTWPHDINVMLVGPAGQKAMLMRHAGGGYAISNAAITIDDNASAVMPNYSGLKTGTYKPSNYGTIYNFASPAPSAPYLTMLSVFKGTNPNGTWSLYVMDDSSGDAGSIQGWSLAITTTTTTPLDNSQPELQPELLTDSLAAKPDITTPPAVWIETIGFNTDGQASLVMSGRPDSSYTLQSSTNFVQWTEVQSGIVPVGQFTVTDLQSGTNTQKFYRVVIP